MPTRERVWTFLDQSLVIIFYFLIIRVISYLLAFFVGALMTFHSYALVSAMITFFVTSTLFTKFRKERKRKLENGSSGKFYLLIRN